MIFSEQQEKFIVDNYYNMTARQVSDILGCKIDQVSYCWYKHGLTGKQRRVYPIQNENIFSVINNPTSAYYLGLIASDGCLYDKHGTGSKIIRISLKKEDEDILHRFAKDLGTVKPITYASGKYASFEISSNQMFDDLLKIGLEPNKTYKNTVPNLDDSVMKYYIRGYFDGDGSITKIESANKTNINISGYQNNLTKIQSYLDRHNIISTFIEDKRNYTEGNGTFGSLVLGNNVSKYAFVKHIYSKDAYPVMKRKYEICCKFAEIIENNLDIPRYKIAFIYYKYAVQEVS